MEEEKMLEKVQEKAKESIDKILEDGIQTTNLEYLDKLIDIFKDTKEVENMRNYGYGYGYGDGGYGRGYGREQYGEYGEEFGARRRDRRGRYRGDEAMDRMAGEYGRYQESRQRYGAGEESDKAFHYMVKAYEEFTKYLSEEAETPEQKQMLREAAQKSIM